MGIVSDDATILKIKHEVLTEVAKLAFAGELDEKKDNLPYEMIPGPEARFRCCIYKEREIIRQRVRLAEGKCPGTRESSNIVQVINLSLIHIFPFSVGMTPRELRVKTVNPISSSSSRMSRLKLGWLMNSCFAAPVMERLRSTSII